MEPFTVRAPAGRPETGNRIQRFITAGADPTGAVACSQVANASDTEPPPPTTAREASGVA
ncbi:hypothetical protein D3C83_214640 [compost metagenome]